ncbi:hypothetical protein [Flavobacterium sp.]|uniref:hypothetical protein n=1 Tax=Flavobacterium sp. TaxID=239 RepID=UPI00286BE881|nr:hypothetical protein [Flavobacterium sp.]
MADKRKLLELDIDVESIIAKSVQLKTTLDSLRVEQDLLKKSGDTNSDTYVKLAAQISKTSAEYNINQKQLSNLARVNGEYLTINQKVGLSLDKEINSITEARVNNIELLKIRNELNLSKKEEKALADEINAKLDTNNKFIKENVSGYEQQKIGIGDYKTAIVGALQETGLFGGQIQNITQFTSNFKGVYSKMNAELSSSISQIKNAGAETDGLGKAQKAGVVATEAGTGALRIFKLALAATGIGLLIIGVGLLVNGLSKLDPIMDSIEQATAGIGGAIDKASQIVVKFVSNITSIGDAFSKIGNLILNPIDSIKSFTKEVGNAATAAAKLKEAEQELGDLKDIYEVRNKNIESQINLDKIRLKSKDLTSKEEIEIEKRINSNFEKLSANRTEVNNKTLDLSLKNAINTAQELNNVDQKRLENSIRLGDLAVANQLLNSGKITTDAYNKLKEGVNSVVDSTNQEAEARERAQDKIEKAQAKAEANAQAIEAAAQKRRDEAAKLVDASIAKSKTELDLFIAQQGIRAKSLEDSLKLEEQIRDKKLAIAKKEFDSKKITQTEFELQSLNIKNEFLKKQADITVANAEIELKSFIDNNKSKLNGNQFLTDELVIQELDRINRVSEAEAAYQTKRLETGKINAQQYADAIKAIDDKVEEENNAVKDAKIAADLEKQAIDYENKLLASENEFANRQAELDASLAQELAAAEKSGADKKLIAEKYATFQKQLDKSMKDFKLSQELEIVQGIKGLFGEKTILGRAAALAEIGITTYTKASAAFAQAALFAANPLTAPLATNAYIQGGIIIAGGAVQAAKVAGVKLKDGAVDIDGPGSTTSDSIPALLSRGESVINAESTAKFKPLLTAINDGVGINFSIQPYPSSVANTYNNNQASQSIDYDLLASKIGVNVANANLNLPAPRIAIEDINYGQDNYAQVVNGANF